MGRVWEMIADDQEKHIKYWLALHPDRTPQDAYEALYGCDDQQLQEMAEELFRAVPKP